MKTGTGLMQATGKLLLTFGIVFVLVVGGIWITGRIEATRPAETKPPEGLVQPAESEPIGRAEPEPARSPPADIYQAEPPMPKGAAVEETHPYTYYSDEVLRDLAAADPAAAVILGRRAEDPAEALTWYERATVLSGQPRPLMEWNQSRNEGGMAEDNGVLDTDKAAIGYELLLVMRRIGYQPASRPIAEFERALKGAGVDLEPIEARAETRFERLTAERQRLVGGTWPGAQI